MFLLGEIIDNLRHRCLDVGCKGRGRLSINGVIQVIIFTEWVMGDPMIRLLDEHDNMWELLIAFKLFCYKYLLSINILARHL